MADEWPDVLSRSPGGVSVGLNKIAVTLYDVFGYLLVPRVDGKKLKTLAEPFAGRSM